jgi:hypothetical protein
MPRLIYNYNRTRNLLRRLLSLNVGAMLEGDSKVIRPFFFQDELPSVGKLGLHELDVVKSSDHLLPTRI